MMKVHMTRTCLNQEPHKNPKFFDEITKLWRDDWFENVRVYTTFVNQYISEIYDSKDITHYMPYEDKNGQMVFQGEFQNLVIVTRQIIRRNFEYKRCSR
jgi:hypothetical protein